MEPEVRGISHRPTTILKRIRLWHYAAFLLATTAAALTWLHLTADARLSLLTSKSRFALYEDDQVVSPSLDDIVLQQVVEKCMQQQDTFIWLQRSGRSHHVAVWDDHRLHLNPGAVDANCALLHIPLASNDRSIGLCTDAALYAQLLGAWITPTTGHGLQHVQNCGYRSAILFLEPLYEDWLNWLTEQQHIVAVYAPNFEQMFAYDEAAHKRMQLVLCKVHRCHQLLAKYLEKLHSTATLMYTGHTSIDAQVLVQQQPPHTSAAAANPRLLRHPGDQQARQQPAQQPQQGSGQQAAPITLSASVQPLSALHVRGKSSLKHTKQLLDCWLQHPDWPQLTVIGPMPNEQITGLEAKRFMAAPNIKVPNPGKLQGPNWPEFEPLAAAELSALLLSHPIHIMPSEREGFGHSINEGRAAGAVLLVPDHPPMNELVREGSGVLLQPRLTFSHLDDPVPVLGAYGNISVSMSPQGICAGVSQVLEKSAAELDAMGRKARALYESDRADFVDSMKDVSELLRSLLQVAEAAAGA